MIYILFLINCRLLLHIYIYSIFKMEDDGFVVPDKINSLKLPVRGKKKTSNKLIGAMASYADVPDGFEAFESEDKEEGYNDYEAHPEASKISSEKTSSLSEKDVPREYFTDFQEDTSDSNPDIDFKKTSSGYNDSSSSSESDSNEEKSIDKKRRNRKNQDTSESESNEDKYITKKRGNRKKSESSVPKKKPRVTTVDVAMNVDVTAMLPLLTFDFESDAFLYTVLGKFSDEVSDSSIIAFCDLYNTKKIANEILSSHEPFFGALKIRTLGIESFTEFFRLLEQCKYIHLYIFYLQCIHICTNFMYIYIY
jgi:hypothetical protein